MEVHHLVLCCLLFTTAVCSRKLDAFPEYADDNQPLEATNQNCKCENGDCVTNKLGRSKCICKPGFSLQDKFTCKPCDCGPLGKCIFVLTQGSSGPSDKYQYEKECMCDVGKAEKDGVCVDCFCGNNSACEFEDDERRCYCFDGYSEKDGVCTECDCGIHGKCEYENGSKKCECDEGYLELNGACEECDCGDHGTCSFVNGQKTCNCEPGFKINNGKCEACDCGSNSENCEFVDGVKHCKCKDRYADRYGTCEECYCGDHTESCSFNENEKTCSCLEGYVQKGETCELGCGVQHPCQNGGYCKEGFCFCLNGTRGEFCEIIDGCSNLCPNQSKIECAFDATSQKAFCRCLDNNLRYDPERKECRRGCEKDNECHNGGKCGSNKFCNCLPGTNGDKCEVVEDCAPGRHRCIGGGAYCSFDVNTKKAICKCKNDIDVYDSRTGSCKYFCKRHGDCLNGGRCGHGGSCSCPPGTRGARCEIVDDCHYGRIRCGGKDSYCAYDVCSLSATCKCYDPYAYYNFYYGRCMYCNSCLSEKKCQAWLPTSANKNG